MLRTELDALPIEEKTGLPFASTVRTKNAGGDTVSVAHACGHDLHVSAWVGTAELMAQNRQRWHGTLMLVGRSRWIGQRLTNLFQAVRGHMFENRRQFVRVPFQTAVTCMIGNQSFQGQSSNISLGGILFE